MAVSNADCSVLKNETHTRLELGDSVLNTLWKQRNIDERSVLSIIQKCELPEIVARILVSRNIAIEDVETFLHPSLRNSLPDPYSFLDMGKAVDYLVSAITDGKTIGVLGDYDVDGATSTSVFKRFLEACGVSVVFYIPDRVIDGYGPSEKAFDQLKEQGASVCVTVDCGTMSFEPLSYAAKIGLDVIVVDHHMGAEELPEAVAVVNPNRFDETSSHGHLAAVGMSFIVCVGIYSRLKSENKIKEGHDINLIELLDLVALGTVCDVVPLKGVNRAFVAQGMKVMQCRKNIGLSALAEMLSLKESPSVYHLGFVIGPRINAGGRVGESTMGTRLLTTDDREQADELSKSLDHFNAERKAIEQQVFDDAMEQAHNKEGNMPCLLIVGDGWHQGVIGIVAGRIKERFHLPTAVISVENGIGKASARSIGGVDFGSVVIEANQSGLLIAGGGHSMAAGFTIEESKIEAFEQFLCDRLEEEVSKNSQRSINIEAALTISSITKDLYDHIAMIGPFGMANPEPHFVFKDVYVIKADILAGQHVRLIVADNFSGRKGASIKAMSFRTADSPLGKALVSSIGKNVHIVGKVRINHWRGVSLPEILIEDLAA